MPLCTDLGEFVRALPARGSVLGLDISRRRIGLAGTDVERRLATPLTTLHRTRFERDVQALADVVRRREVRGLVVGLPLELDGRFGRLAQAAKETAKALDRSLGLPIWLQDERYSTAEASERGGDDAMAACVILEDALAQIARLGLR
jgi:putative holliday junction resolvase